MGLRRIIFLSIITFGYGSCTAAYQLTVVDHFFLRPYELRLDALTKTSKRSTLLVMATRLQDGAKQFPDDTKEATLLRELAAYVIAHLPIEESPIAPSLPVGTGVVAFVDQYKQQVTSSMEFSEDCRLYYPVIDALAQQQDFPTALIIATRWREYSCRMENPSNGRGIFQITSHQYTPGPLTQEAMLEQVQHFIDFSRAKRAYHDRIQPFDEIPITLSHDSYDLLSLQKHSIMYNGLKSGVTPETSVYANQNFGMPAEGRDGIVAMVIKVLAWWKGEQ